MNLLLEYLLKLKKIPSPFVSMAGSHFCGLSHNGCIGLSLFFLLNPMRARISLILTTLTRFSMCRVYFSGTGSNSSWISGESSRRSYFLSFNLSNSSTLGFLLAFSSCSKWSLIASMSPLSVKWSSSLEKSSLFIVLISSSSR